MQYIFWSFKLKDTKLDRFLAENKQVWGSFVFQEQILQFLRHKSSLKQNKKYSSVLLSIGHFLLMWFFKYLDNSFMGKFIL